jgi:hypothetical protein
VPRLSGKGAGWLLGSNQKGWKGGSERTKKRSWCHLGAGLHEIRLLESFGASEINEMEGLASFGGWVTRNGRRECLYSSWLGYTAAPVSFWPFHPSLYLRQW